MTKTTQVVTSYNTNLTADLSAKFGHLAGLYIGGIAAQLSTLGAALEADHLRKEALHFQTNGFLVVAGVLRDAANWMDQA